MLKKYLALFSFIVSGFVLADPPDWSINPPSYEFSGSVSAGVYLNDVMVGSEDDILAGFVDGEIRGLVTGLVFPPTGSYIFSLLLYSNQVSGETVNFKFYHADSDQVFDLNETLAFESDMIIANAFSPYTLNGYGDTDGGGSDDSGDFAYSGMPDWDTNGDGVLDNYNDYENNGSITSTILVDGISYANSGDMIAGFVDGEQRGVGIPTLVPFGPYADTYQFQMMLYSNVTSGETLTFQFYDQTVDAVYNLAETTEFESNMVLGNVVAPYVFTFNPGDDVPDDISGCLDEAACNYNPSATVDDGSCEYAQENFDCDGNCLIEVDCDGVCGGDAVFDECGVCDNLPFNDCEQDCSGEWGGDAIIDDCGICDGPGAIYECGCEDIEDGLCDCDGNTLDCAGECGGNSYVDECGTCDELPFNDCVQDCAGDWGGDALIDECGVCDDDASNDCVQDCNGDWGGDAVIDECGICGGDDLNDNGFCDPDCPENYSLNPQFPNVEDSNVCVPDLFTHNASTQQAMYSFNSVTIAGLSIDNDDWVGAFNGDVCVGSQLWNTDNCSSGICSLNLMGYDGSDFTTGYLLDGQTPNFKIYDSSENEYFDAYSSTDIPWESFGVNNINLLSTQVSGCVDIEACNYNSDALEDDGSCIYPEECLDCDGLCICETDCEGVCGGDAVADQCGECNGDNSSCSGCTDSEALNYDASATIDDGSCIFDYDLPPELFVFNQSSLQAFYFFQTASIDNVLLEENDWVAAFNGDICVGARKWDTSACNEGVCDVPVMGNDGEEYSLGYMESGQVPTFKIYDYSEGNFYDAVSSENVPWENLELNYLDSINVFPDCFGALGGTAVEDECGVCDGPGAVYECGCEDITEGACDCDGNVLDECGDCGGNNEAQDDCGVCYGDNADQDECGVCFGNGYTDECGLCDDDSTNDCLQDCTGEWGGDAVIDECGVCDGPGSVYECGCADIPDGDCDCDGNIVDECGICAGSGYEDECGVCDEDTSNDCVQDCNGDWGGTVEDFDQDGICDDVDICPEDPENDIDGDGLCCNESNIPNSYLEFDGIDDHINLGNSHQLQFVSHDFTASAKINISDLHSGAIFSNYRCYGQYPLWQLRAELIDENTLVMMFELRPGGHTFFGTTNVADGQWHNVVLVRDDSNYKIYIDGNLEISHDVDMDPVTENQDLYIGVQHSDCGEDGYFYKGLMDNAILWNAALDANDVFLLSNSSDLMYFENIVGYWDFEEGQGAVLTDQSSFENDGIIYGNPVWLNNFNEADPCCYDVENDADGDGECGNVDECPYDSENDADGDGICADEEIFGCTDEGALNYDESATEEDDSCYYTLDIELSLHTGANLSSFYALPEDTGLSTMFSSVSNSIEGVITEGYASLNVDGSWIGGVLSIEPSNGYWLIMDNDETLSVTGYPVGSDYEYNLHSGANLLSFPDQGMYAVEDVLPLSLQGTIYGIIAENESATYYNGEWVGSLEYLEGTKGYWFKTYNDISLVFDINETLTRIDNQLVEQDNVPLDLQYNQSSAQSFYYIKEVNGIQTGDWIVAYNNDIIVGTRQWNGEMIDVPVMGSDGYDYSFGYCSSGDVPQFSLYKQQTGELIPLYSQEIKEWSSNDISIIEVLNDQDINIPSSFAISNIYPNPFNPSTTIDISIPENMTISLRVLDLHGRVVDVIMEQDIVAGSHLFKYDGSNLSSGVYFIELQSSEYVQYSKMILLK